jgi:bifunctional non-homologous end joining protein LigD
MKSGKYTVTLSHTEKLYFPHDHISKGDVISYYKAVSEFIIPHLHGRPITMQRFPEGINQSGFFQKKRSDHFPDWVKTLSVKTRDNHLMNMAGVTHEAALIYLVNQGTIAFHSWLSRIDKPDMPDALIYDLDPSIDAFHMVAEAADILKEFLTVEMGLHPLLMTTGSRGLHVIVPLRRQHRFDTVRNFARKLANHLAAKYPKLLTTEVSKEKRGQRIFIDYLRNGYAQTAIAPYSLRPLPGAPVASPLRWHELRGSMSINNYNLHSVPQRLEQLGNVWAEETGAPHALSRAIKMWPKVQRRDGVADEIPTGTHAL